MDEENQRAAHMLTDLYLRLNRIEEAVQNAQEIYSTYPENYILAMDSARSLLRAGRYTDCLSVLQKTVVLPYEGAWEGRDVYRQANVLQAAQLIAQGNTKKASEFIAKAREWPEHLGVGRPFDVDERLEDYLQARAHQISGNKTEAEDAYQKIILYTSKNRTGWRANHCFGLLAYDYLGQKKAGQSLLEDWTKARTTDDPAVRFARALLSEDRQILKTLSGQSVRNRDLSLLLKIFTILVF